jgi:hypothetical protein
MGRVANSAYCDTYRLLSGYLALRDENLATDNPPPQKSATP